MISTIIIAFIITILIGFTIENFMLNFDIRRTYQINMELKDLILKIIEDRSYFDIFIINDIRNLINEEFLNTKIIDKYELYKIDDLRIKLKYIKGYVSEELELLAVDGRIELKEINKELVS